MTRSMLFAGIAVVLGAPGRNARADELKPEEIIDKAIRAHGGEEKLTDLSAFTLKERRTSGCAARLGLRRLKERVHALEHRARPAAGEWLAIECGHR